MNPQTGILNLFRGISVISVIVPDLYQDYVSVSSAEDGGAARAGMMNIICANHAAG